MDHSRTENDGTHEIMGHKLLRGGRKPYPNTLSPRQMDSLTALCDTFVPIIDISEDNDTGGNDDLRTFYRTSASMIDVPNHFGGYVSGRLNHPSLGQLRVVFWFLSTWFGTFILCGRASLSTRFPYFQKFSQVSQKKREEIVMSWSSSSFNHLKMLFKSLKYIILVIFFTLTDEKNVNPSWRALGYSGPDPDFVNQNEQTMQPKKEGGGEQEAEEQFGPLYKAIIDMDIPRSMLLKSLQKSGFSVSTSPDRRLTKTLSRTLSSSLTIHCDVVVIGSGSGGGLVAGVLANAGHKVVVLEKGDYYARRNLSLLEGPSMDQMYEDSGLLTTNDLAVVVLAGSTVGGGSTINWSAAIRTPTHVINEWSTEYGLDLFNRPAYKEAMDIVCEKMGIQSEIHEEGFNNEVLRRGCLELGYPVIDIPRNSPSDHYCGWCNFGCKDGRKKSTQETWLMDLVNSGNGVILPRCKALNVLHDEHVGFRNKAIGVVFEFESKDGKKETHVIKSKVTVVSCGALSTPPLLKRSGLRNPNIGKHLHIHPTILAWGYFPESSSAWPDGKKKSYKGGIMTAMSTVITNFETSGYGAMIQTPIMHPGMFSAMTPWVSGIDFKERMRRFSRTAHIFALARDKGSGEVPNFPNSLTYKLDRVDKKNLKMGLEKALRILAAAGAEEIGTHHFEGPRLNVKCASLDELERFIDEASRRALRDLSTPISSAHQMGSCRMGVDPKKSVVNQKGETWEVEGLFIADSSVFPTALGVNPMVTVQAISYCTARSVLEFLKGIS